MRIIDKEIVALKKRLEKNKIQGLALDIDDTVADTGMMWMEKIVSELGNPEGLTIRELTDKYSYGRGTSYWIKEEYEVITKSLRHSNEFYMSLPLITGVKEQLEKINKIISIVAFITARPKNVESGTNSWVKSNGLLNVPVINKPNQIKLEKQTLWKVKVLEFLYPQVRGIVDDNVDLVRTFSSDYKGTVFLYNQEVVDRNDIEIIPCKDWNKVLSEAKKRYS